MITYCSLVWVTRTPSLINELEHIHARAAKTIHRLPWDISDQEALESTRWEPLSNQRKKKLITLIYKVNSNITPVKITNLFSIAYSNYHLRDSNHLVLPRYSLSIGTNSIRYRGSPSLKQSHSLTNFKNRFKQRHHKTFTGTHQMEPVSPIQALGVNPFPSRFINRTIPLGGFAC